MTVDWPGEERPDAGTVELDDSAITAERDARRFRWTGLAPLGLAPLAAALWWVVISLGWIVDGLTIGDSAPHTALRLFGTDVGPLAVGGVLGGLLAGLLATLGHGPRRWSALAVSAGVLVCVAATLVQSFTALSDPDPSNMSTADRTLVGLSIVVVVATLFGLVCGLLSLTGRVGQGLALAAVAGCVPVWAVYVGSQTLSSWDAFGSVDRLARWLGAAILVAALVRIGVRPVSSVIWWVVATVGAWVVPPTTVALSVLGQALRPGTPSSVVLDVHVPFAWRAWRAAAGFDSRPLVLWIVALVLAVVVSRARERPDGTDRATA
jgi:hypothetical protein